MKLLNFIFLVSAQISFEHLVKSKDEHINCNKTPSKYLFTNYSLSEGLFALETPALTNFRFFSPYGHIAFKMNTTTWFSKDYKNDGLENPMDTKHSNFDRLHHVVCKLFPSERTNILSIYSEDDSNFAIMLQQSKVKNNFVMKLEDKNNKIVKSDIQFLACLLFSVLNKSKGISAFVSETDTGMMISIKDSNSRNKQFSIDYAYHFDRSTGKRSDEKIIETLNILLNIDEHTDCLFNTGTIIKAYIAMYLESEDEISTLYRFLEQELITFFSAGVINSNFAPSTIEKIVDSLKKIVAYEKNKPYFNVKPNYYPASLNLVRRSLDTSEVPLKGAESAIFNFLSCLLWDARGKYRKIYQKNVSNSNSSVSSNTSNYINSSKSSISNNASSDTSNSSNLINTSNSNNISNSSSSNNDISNTRNRELSKISSFLCQNHPQILNQTNIEQWKAIIEEAKKEVFEDNSSLSKPIGLMGILKIIGNLTGRDYFSSEKIEKLLDEKKSQNYDYNEITLIILDRFIHDILGSETDTIEIEFLNGKVSKKDHDFDATGSLKVTIFTPRVGSVSITLNVEPDGIWTDVIYNKCHPKVFLAKKDYLLDLISSDYTSKSDPMIKMLVYRCLHLVKDKDYIQEKINLLIKNGYKINCSDLLWLLPFDSIENSINLIEECLTGNTLTESDKKLFSISIGRMIQSIPLYKNNDFKGLKELQNRYFDIFYPLECTSNDYYLKQGLKECFGEFFNVDEALDHWKNICSEFPISCTDDLTKNIQRFLNDLLFSEKNRFLTLNKQKIQIINVFSFSLNLFLSKDVGKFSNGEYFPVIFANVFTKHSLLPVKDCYSNGPFYTDLIDQIENESTRVSFLTAFISSICSLENDCSYYFYSYFLNNYPDLFRKVLESRYFTPFFYCYLGHILNERDEEVELINSKIGKCLSKELESFLIRKWKLTALHPFIVYVLTAYLDRNNDDSIKNQSFYICNYMAFHLKNLEYNPDYSGVVKQFSKSSQFYIYEEDFTYFYHILKILLSNVEIDTEVKSNLLDEIKANIPKYYQLKDLLKSAYQTFDDSKDDEIATLGDIDVKILLEKPSYFEDRRKSLLSVVETILENMDTRI